MMRNIKVDNYVKIKRVGIEQKERKNIRDLNRKFEVDILMLVDEALF